MFNNFFQKSETITRIFEKVFIICFEIFTTNITTYIIRIHKLTANDDDPLESDNSVELKPNGGKYNRRSDGLKGLPKV